MAACIERPSFEPSVFGAGFSFSMLDKSSFYWLEAGFDFYKIATVWRNLELILHSSSLQRSLHSQTLTSPLKKRGHLENRKRIILKNHNFFRVTFDFLYSSLGDVNLLFLGRPYRFSQVSMSFFRSLGRLQCWTTFHLPTFQHGLNNSLCQLL